LNYKNILFITGSFIIGLGIGKYLKYKIFESNFQTALWKKEPALIICNSSAVKDNRVKDATLFWEKYNHKVSLIHRDETDTICGNKNKIKGMILLKGNEGNIPNDSLGTTNRLSTLNLSYNDNKIGEMLFASIEIYNEYIDLDLLLEHELGHAFGYSHLEEVNHVMYPEFNFMGDKFYLNKKE
tara:strand:+ start:753 stop:1301 length:549 start_codon:yes stop_codon:yes gene_type:complete